VGYRPAAGCRHCQTFARGSLVLTLYSTHSTIPKVWTLMRPASLAAPPQKSHQNDRLGREWCAMTFLRIPCYHDDANYEKLMTNIPIRIALWTLTMGELDIFKRPYLGHFLLSLNKCYIHAFSKASWCSQTKNCTDQGFRFTEGSICLRAKSQKDGSNASCCCWTSVCVRDCGSTT